MKVIMINSSPHERGCVNTALHHLAGEFSRQGVDTEIIHIGKANIHSCIACGECRRIGRCVQDDLLNDVVGKIFAADGLIFATPVYYAGISGQLKCFMDRLFHAYGRRLGNKPVAAVVNSRRSGCVAAFNDINNFFTMSNMLVVTSQYWNQVHGARAEEVQEDQEGLQTMRTLAKNMTWIMRCIEAGKQAGIPLPVQEPVTYTNFTRTDGEPY